MPIIESVMGIQVIGNNGENIIKSPIVEAYIGSSLLDSTKVASDAPTDISTKVEQLMAAKHSHSNKAVLDKFAEGGDGKPTYNGIAVGGGSGGASTAESVDYSNAALPSVTNVKTALDALVPKSHSHSNKSVLDKFAETDGKPTYDGKALGGGGASDFIIKMTVEANGNNYTVTSCDATIEQIDAAVSAEKRVVLIVSVGGTIIELPMVQGVKGDSYYFSTFLSGQVTASFVQKVGGNTSEWQFLVAQIEAESVNYSNAALPNVTNVRGALDALVPKSHSHSNKGILDQLSESNGKLQYNGSDVGLKGDKGDKGDPGSDGKTPVKGTDYWTESDKAEIVADTLAALPTWTGGNY